MASTPGKRTPRKAAVDGGEAAIRQPPLVDPETVAAVRRATAKTVHALVTATRVSSRALARGSVVTARWLWPRLRRGSAVLARALWRGLAASARWTWTRRGAVVRVAHRGLWWGALAILIMVGRALLTADGNPELIEVALLWLSAGLSMSVLVLLGAPETRMRVAAFALASGHGSLAALAWVVATGV